jgi:hypothetical protein
MQCKRTLYVDCKKQLKLAMDDLYRRQQSPVDPKSKVISEFNLMLLKELSKKEALNLQ